MKEGLMVGRQQQALDPEKIAEILGLHYDTVVRMLRRGQIPGRRIGRLWRTDPDLFSSWLRQGEPHLAEHPLIASSPNVMLGKPVIAGTRITVEHVMREMAAGSTIDDLLRDHPSITREQFQAAIEFGIAASGRITSSFKERDSA
jgi:excisionase family DNA binding protein